MDVRLNVYGALGLAEGDAHMIRNAGGVVRHSIRRLQASPFITHKNVRGFIYEVEKGTLREIA